MLSIEEHRRARVKPISPEAAAHTFAWREMLGQRDELMMNRASSKEPALVDRSGHDRVDVLATIVAVLQIKPRYSATAKPLLDPQASHFFKAEVLLSCRGCSSIAR